MLRGRITPPAELYSAIEWVSELLGRDVCWLYQRRYHFELADGWTLALSAESAGRIRVETCHWTRPVVTLWTFAEDKDRLAELVFTAADELGAPAGV